jgi:hypothetical protein
MADMAPGVSSKPKGKAPMADIPPAKFMPVEERERLEEEKQNRKRSKQAMRAREVEDARKGILKETPTKAASTPTPMKDEEPEARAYFLTDGTETTANPMFDIHRYLRAQPSGYGVVSMDKFKTDVGIDLKDPRNADLLQGLCHNEMLDVGESTLKRRHPMGVENEHMMYTLFQDDIPNGRLKTNNGLNAMGVSEKQLVDCFDGADMCIDEMIKDGVVEEICTKDSTSGRMQRVFFPAVKGMAASKDLRDLWHSIEVPGGAQLKEELLKRGLRTPQEYEMRKKREKERREKEIATREREKQLAKAEKKEARDKAKFNEMCQKRGWDWMIHD